MTKEERDLYEKIRESLLHYKFEHGTIYDKTHALAATIVQIECNSINVAKKEIQSINESMEKIVVLLALLDARVKSLEDRALDIGSVKYI